MNDLLNEENICETTENNRHISVNMNEKYRRNNRQHTVQQN